MQCDNAAENVGPQSVDVVNNPRTVNVGIVGIGFGQHAQLPAFRSDSRCRVVAICASSRDRATAVAAKLGVERAYGDWREMINDPELDAISIAVPPVLQPAIVIAAANAGKAVFCEKPVAPDASQARFMLDAVTRAKVVHSVDFLFPELPAWIEAKQAIDSNCLGRLLHASVSWKVETRAVREQCDSWKLRRAQGGGTLNSFVSHTLYYLEWLLGPIISVAARLSPRNSPDDIRVNAWFVHADGCESSIEVATDACQGSGHRLEIYGDSGSVVLENPSSDYVSGFQIHINTRHQGRLVHGEPPSDSSEIDGRIAIVGRIVRRFTDALIHGKSASPNLSHGLRVQELIESIRSADAMGIVQYV